MTKKEGELLSAGLVVSVKRKRTVQVGDGGFDSVEFFAEAPYDGTAENASDVIDAVKKCLDVKIVEFESSVGIETFSNIKGFGGLS